MALGSDLRAKLKFEGLLFAAPFSACIKLLMACNITSCLRF